MPVLPGHNYLGPGNLIFGKPVDRDDEIALKHDVLYQSANSHSDIRKADVEAIDDFFENFQETKNFHSLIGGTGLWFKKQFEDYYGPVYGMNSGQKKYSNWQKAAWAKYRELKKSNPSLTQEQYKASDHFKQIKGLHGFAGASAVSFIQTDPKGADAVSFVPRRTESNNPSDGSPSSSGRGSAAAKRPRVDNNPSVAPDNVSDPDISNNSAEITEDMLSNAHEPMEVEGATTRTTGGGRNSGGVSRSITSGPIMIPRNRTPNPVTYVFTKNWTFFSFGFANAVLSQTMKNIRASEQMESFITSMNYIPVDFLPFYLSKSEYSNLPYNCKVKEVSVNIRILGSRTSFDTATSLSGTANSEYCPIGMVSIGLNHKHQMNNCSIKSTQMVPTALENINYEDLINKWYDSHSAGVMGIPRHNNCYAAMCRGLISTEVKKSIFRDFGANMLVQDVDRFLINSVIGEEIVNYHYSPQNAFITGRFPVKLTSDVKLPGSFRYPAKSITMNANPDNTNKFQLDTTLPSKFSNLETSNLSSAIYERNIESGTSCSITGKYSINSTQPQVHLGVLAVPQINPDTSNTTFQNSALYYSVEASIVIEQLGTSAMALKSAPYTSHVTMTPSVKPILTDGFNIGNLDVVLPNPFKGPSNYNDSEELSSAEESDNDAGFQLVDKRRSTSNVTVHPSTGLIRGSTIRRTPVQVSKNSDLCKKINEPLRKISL